MNKEATFQLSDCEVETLRRAAVERDLDFNPQKREYSTTELKVYGLVREAYTKDELRSKGYGPQKIDSFHDKATSARSELKVETPFGSGIEKWELPVFMPPLRVHNTVFPPNTSVAPHVHPLNSAKEPGGGLRVVISGSILYEEKEYKPGDWFFVPNGEPYAFRTDPQMETVVLYTYAFFKVEEGNRFSHPHARHEVSMK